MMRLNRSY